jgi:hypothetical protein
MQLVVDATVDSVWTEDASSPGMHSRRMAHALVHDVVAGTWVKDGIEFQDPVGSVATHGARNHFVLVWHQGPSVDHYDGKGLWQAQIHPNLRLSANELVLDVSSDSHRSHLRESRQVLGREEYQQWRDWISEELQRPSSQASHSNTVLVGKVISSPPSPKSGPVPVNIWVEQVLKGTAPELETILTPNPNEERKRWAFTHLIAPRLREGQRALFFVTRTGDSASLVDGRHMFYIDADNVVSTTGESIQAFLRRTVR